VRSQLVERALLLEVEAFDVLDRGSEVGFRLGGFVRRRIVAGREKSRENLVSGRRSRMTP